MDGNITETDRHDAGLPAASRVASPSVDARATAPASRSQLLREMISDSQRTVDKLADTQGREHTLLLSRRADVAKARKLLADAETNLADQEARQQLLDETLTKQRMMLVNLQAQQEQ